MIFRAIDYIIELPVISRAIFDHVQAVARSDVPVQRLAAFLGFPPSPVHLKQQQVIKTSTRRCPVVAEGLTTYLRDYMSKKSSACNILGPKVNMP